MLKSKFIADILELPLGRDHDRIRGKYRVEFITKSDYEYTNSGVFIGFEHKTGIEKYRCKKKI